MSAPLPLFPEPPVNSDLIDRIVAYESGSLSEEETIEFFQHLIDTEVVWKLQGHYGRMAAILLDNGLVTL